MALLLVLIYILIAELSKAVDDGRVKEQDGVTLRILTYLTCFSLAFFPLVWLVGQVLPVPLSPPLSLSLSHTHTHIRSLPRSLSLSLSPSKSFAVLTRGWSEQEGAASASLTTLTIRPNRLNLKLTFALTGPPKTHLCPSIRMICTRGVIIPLFPTEQEGAASASLTTEVVSFPRVLADILSDRKVISLIAGVIRSQLI